ncbi:MAG: hypothetical protein N2115_07840 [bacterium]|nr:hypothetical protein [bacterium]
MLLKDVSIGLKLMDKKKVNRVYCVPSYESPEFTIEDNYVWLTIPEVSGYKMVVIE